MSEKLSVNLTPDYFKSPQVQIRKGGESSAIGMFDPNRKKDMQNLLSAYNRDELSDVDTEGEPIENVINWAQNPVGKRDVVFAIRGSQNVPDKEKSEVQGFVYFYSSPGLVKELRANGHLEEFNRATRFFELSFAAKEGAHPHQVSSAVRQSIDQLLRMDMGKRKNEGKQVVSPQIQIIASVDEKNEPSLNVLRAVGFVPCGKADYYGEGVSPVYRLDWEKYNEIMHANKNLRALLESITRNGITRTNGEISKPL